MNILSIQSWVASGHVGNAAAMFPLQVLGAEVTAVHTVQFSNHPGHGAFTGQVFPPADIDAMVAGLAAHGALARCDAVLSGYIGEAAVGTVILDAVAQVRHANPAALWCCDPVIGDDGRVYVRPGVAGFFLQQAVPEADILVPNQFELATLTASPCATLPQAMQAIGSLRARMRAAGPRLVLATSVQTDATPADAIDMLLGADEGFCLLRTPLLPAKFSGAGDTLAALFLFHILSGRAPATAALQAARSIAGLLRHTWQSSAQELQIVAAQSEFTHPTGVVQTIPF